MDDIFELKDYKLTISPMAYSLVPFKKLWDRDKSKGKSRAVSELSYIYFMCHYKSDYSDIVDIEERHNEVVKGVMGRGVKFNPDKLVMEAMKFFESRQDTLLMRMFKVATIGLGKIEKYIKEIELDEKDSHGKPIHNITHLKNIVKELADMAESINDLEKKAKAELMETSNAKGNKKKADFEDEL